MIISSEWREITLGKIAEVQTGPFGSQLKNEQYIRGGTPVITVEHIKEFKIENFDYPSVTDEDKERLNKYTLKSGDTLGYPAFVPKIRNKKLLHNQRLGKIENNIICKSFLYLLMCGKRYRNHILGTASGSTVRHSSPSRICDYEFVCPDSEVLKAFADVVDLIISKKSLNLVSIQTLTKTRDLLLPKLMSGEIRIKEGGD